MGLGVWLAGTHSAWAQQPAIRFAGEAGGFYATVSGDDFTGTNAGTGADAQFRLVWTALSVGLGFQRSQHDVVGFSNNLIVAGFFVEPRYAFPVTGPITPFLTARAARVTQTIQEGASKGTAIGSFVGAGGGVAFKLSPVVRANVMATYSQVSFGNARIDGTTYPDTDSHGSSLMLRAGLTYYFGAMP